MTIVLSDAGQSGTVASWTAGGVFGPGTRIGIDTSPLTSSNRLQHAMLHGYLIAKPRLFPFTASRKAGRRRRGSR